MDKTNEEWAEINYQDMLKELQHINQNVESIHHQDIVDFVKNCPDITKCRLMVFSWGRYNLHCGLAKSSGNADCAKSEVKE